MKTRLTLVRILTVFIVTSAVLLSFSSTVSGTPLFFDFFKRTFGKGNNNRPASNQNNQRPQGSGWATGGQYQKQKKFPWDIFGIFGYKNVIKTRPQRPGPPYRPPSAPRPTRPPYRPSTRPPYRPTNPTRPPYRPTITGRPPYFPDTSTWPNNCNCGWSISNSPTGGPVIVANNNNAGSIGQASPEVIMGRPPGVALPPPSAPGAPVAPKPPPSVTLVQTVNIENGTTTFKLNNNGYNNGRPVKPGGNMMVNLGGGILNSGVNFNSGGFNPAQQFTPASEVLPGYQPGNRATLPPQAAFSPGTAPTVTTQPGSTIEEGDFGIEYEEEEVTTFLPFTIPRQNRNQDLDDQDLPQPEFGIDIVEEPAAEPISTFGDGWIPMRIDQVIKTISEDIDNKVEVTTTPLATTKKRIPKVLQWFDNPYFIQQKPNLEALDNGEDDKDINDIIDNTKETLDDNVGEKRVPSLRGVSISDNPSAFQRSVNNLATLAYATETGDYTSTEDTGILSSRSGKDIDKLENDLFESSTESNLGIWRLIATPTADPDSLGINDINKTPLFYPSKAGLPNNPTTPISTTSTSGPSSIEPPSFFEKFIRAKKQKSSIETPAILSSSTPSPVQLRIIEKPLEVSTVNAKIVSKSNNGFFEPITPVPDILVDPLYNWIWADVDENADKDFDTYDNYHADDLRDPDMTTVGTGTSGIASAAILKPENADFRFPEDEDFKFPDNAEFKFPTLEPGFDLLSDDWFQVNVTETAIKENEVNDDAMMTKENLKAALDATTVLASTESSDTKSNPKRSPEKFMLYYPLSGTPFYKFSRKSEIDSPVKK